MAKVVVYGLSTEGYSLACQMALKGVDVSIIDESTATAISLKGEIAKTYPNVSAFKDDELLLPMEPIDVAISKAQYVFFTPIIGRTGEDPKTETNAKFKDAAQSMKKNSSLICNTPTGFGGNEENISLLEHVTGFEIGKSIHYYYYPVSQAGTPKVVGSFHGEPNEELLGLLPADKKPPVFVNLLSAEHFHAINVLGRFSSMCSVLEVCKFAQDNIRAELALDEYSNIFLDDMVNGMYDIKCLSASFEGSNSLAYLINGSIKGIENYAKRLSEYIRTTLKKNELKASRTKIALSWTLDPYEMRGDKIEMLQNLTARLRDYIGDVETYGSQNIDLFHTDKTTIVVSCSKKDFESISKRDIDFMVIKANPLYETIQ